jgi:hypothetical protein
LKSDKRRFCHLLNRLELDQIFWSKNTDMILINIDIQSDFSSVCLFQCSCCS